MSGSQPTARNIHRADLVVKNFEIMKTKTKTHYFEITFEGGVHEYACLTSDKTVAELSFYLWELTNTKQERERGNIIYAITPCTEYAYIQWSLAMKLTERINLNKN